ncbi:hypothetical protein HAX54_011612 [Datura stramonium]|uniref:PPM-type phosphatase domain-containing protein n=1 Tax=Datura stramonium TaxID=4076 RepID=A0ABS8TJ93_DATST|nr:hypothetical protein [Datura stramonium]
MAIGNNIKGKFKTISIPLSIDHKPDRSDERERIEQAGGFIIWAGTWRVGGVLAVSRAFGDKMLKPYVVADPEIQVYWLCFLKQYGAENGTRLPPPLPSELMVASNSPDSAPHSIGPDMKKALSIGPNGSLPTLHRGIG